MNHVIGVFIINFEQVPHLFLYFWLSARICLLGEEVRHIFLSFSNTFKDIVKSSKIKIFLSYPIWQYFGPKYFGFIETEAEGLRPRKDPYIYHFYIKLSC